MGAMGGGATGQQRLDSWKEIGAFFGRDERTVKRWERERGLPVHRVPGSGRGRVYAYPHELTEWLQSAGVVAEIDNADAGADAATSTDSPSGEVEIASAIGLPELPGLAQHVAAEMAERAKPVLSDYEQSGYPRSGESPARIPEPVPRLSLVQPKMRVEAEPARDVYRESVPQRDISGEHELTLGRVSSTPRDSAAAEKSSTEPANETSTRAGWIWALAVCVLLLAAAAAWGVHHYQSQQSTTAARTQASSAEAENLYLQGKYYWQQRNPEGLTKAVDLFTQAIVHDPQYAPAYAGLAECYDLLREYTSMPDKEAFPRAISAAERAIALNPNLAQAHAALAFALFYCKWDTQRALDEFERAQQLDPNAATTHHWYATALMTVHKRKEALAQIEEARKLDPGSPAIMADKGWILLQTGRIEEARELLLQVEQSDPNFYSPHNYLAQLAFIQGDGKMFAEESRKAAAMRNDPEQVRIADLIEKAYLAGGTEGMRKAWATDVRGEYAAGRIGPFKMAELEAQAGHKDEALRLLELAYDKRDPSMRDLLTQDTFFGYRGDPRFQAILQKMDMANL